MRQALWEAEDRWGPRGTPQSLPVHSPTGENLSPRMVPSLYPTMRFWPPRLGCSHCWPLAVPTSTQSSWGLGDKLIIWGEDSKENIGQVQARSRDGRSPGTHTGGLPASWLGGTNKQLHISSLVWLIYKMSVVLSTLPDYHRDPEYNPLIQSTKAYNVIWAMEGDVAKEPSLHSIMET